MDEPVALKQSQNKGKSALVLTCGIITAVFVCIAIVIGLAIGIIAFTFGSLKSTAVYQDSVAQATDNPEVINALGHPIETGFFLSGSVNVNNDSGDASLAIPLSGSKRDGTLYVEATRTSGVWSFHVLEVEVEGSSGRINLLSGTGR